VPQPVWGLTDSAFSGYSYTRGCTNSCNTNRDFQKKSLYLYYNNSSKIRANPLNLRI
jgi:hypothetical protein